MSPVREEWRALARLALPIVLTNLGTMLLGTVDMLMVGHLNDPQALAAASLANVWIHGTSLFAMGLVYGIDPLVTQAHGARDRARVARALQRALVVALGAGLATALLWSATGRFLTLARELLPDVGPRGGLTDETIERAQAYSRVQAWSAPPFLAFVALRQWLQGRNIVRPALWIIVVSNLFNAGANQVLIHGGLGFPAMGLVGAGIATAWTRAIMLVALLGVVLSARLQRGGWVPWGRASLSPQGIGEILRYGVPTAVQLGLEIWAFGFATLMASRLGDREASAHQIVLNMSSMTFMVPMGVGFAAATRVGNLIGAGRRERAQTAAWVAFATGAGAMSLAALFIVLTGTWVPSLYFRDLAEPEVRAVLGLCGTVLPIVAAFQIFDGTQVVGCGILRGMGRTLPAALMNLVGYWGLALPLAYWMTFSLGLGLRGVWWGIALGLALVACGLVAFVRWRGPGHEAGARGRRPRGTS